MKRRSAFSLLFAVPVGLLAFVPYLVGLLLIGTGVARLALELANKVPQHVAPAEIWTATRDSQIAMLVGIVVIGISTPWIDLGEERRLRFRETVEQSSEWIVRLGELVLIAAVFQLAADKAHLWPLQALALLIFACLVLHTMKPVSRLVLYPAMRALPKRHVIGVVLGLLTFIATLFITATVVVSLSIGLKALLNAGIVKP